MKTLKQKIAELPEEEQDKIKVKSAQIINQYINKEKNIMEAIITLIIFTLILFSFSLGILFGKTFFQSVKPADSTTFTQEMAEAIANEITDSYGDFRNDFIGFSDNN